MTNLDSNVPEAAAFPDANLTNAWGLAFAPGGAFWVNANHSGNSNLFKGDGSLVSLVVTIPAPPNAPLGTISSPTGILSNPTTAFFVPGSQVAAAFIFSAEDGTVSAWNPKVDATHAVLAVDNSSSGAVYKGLAFGSNVAWGLARAPYGFGQFSGDILIGNQQDGRINAFDAHGNFVGALRRPGGEAVKIDKLWALQFGGGANSNPEMLIFTAGPNDENNGLFGVINAVARKRRDY